MPIAARKIGIANVEQTEPNTVGYAVHMTVSTTTNQTWLASQTGAMAWWA
ncbi:MAG TPA: hypothetical protein VGH89_16655 [Pseudonocardia sp.]|jgi:hypothetical protein